MRSRRTLLLLPPSELVAVTNFRDLPELTGRAFSESRCAGEPWYSGRSIRTAPRGTPPSAAGECAPFRELLDVALSPCQMYIQQV